VRRLDGEDEFDANLAALSVAKSSVQAFRLRATAFSHACKGSAHASNVFALACTISWRACKSSTPARNMSKHPRKPSPHTGQRSLLGRKRSTQASADAGFWCAEHIFRRSARPRGWIESVMRRNTAARHRHRSEKILASRGKIFVTKRPGGIASSGKAGRVSYLAKPRTARSLRTDSEHLQRGYRDAGHR